MDRRTPEKARSWAVYMPRRGNGGVPLGSDVTQFLDDTRTNPALRLKVLSELRERACLNSATQFGIAACGLAALAILATIIVSVDGIDLAAVVSQYGISAVCLAILPGVLAIISDSRSRHANSWLAAYEDGLAVEVANEPRVDRSTHHPLEPASVRRQGNNESRRRG